ncbi:hypothetical protein LY78DRAFT_725842 [Colletotrichum sublineola]|nr:hypothetical protein LY78DRAFT_725842 [Colletotrichum sublineola]
MHQPPPADQWTFESRAQYNLQATADDDDEERYELEKKVPPPIPKRANYRPKPLRWPFIVCMIVVLIVLMSLVVYANETMPNSDSTATIEPRHVMQPRQQPSSAEQQSSVAEPSPSSTPESVSSHSQVNVVSSGDVELPTTSERKQPPASSSTPVPPVSQSIMAVSESDKMRQMKGASASISTASGASSAVASSTGLADQRKAPATGTATLSTTLILSSTSMGTITKFTSRDEVILISKSTFTSTFTSNGSTVTYSTNYTSFVSSTFTTLIPTTFSGRTGSVTASAITRTTTRIAPGTSFMTTMSLPMTTTRVIPVSDGPEDSSLTITQTTTRVVTSAVVVTPGTIIEVTTEFPEQTPGGDDSPPSTGFYTSTGVTVMPTTIATVATSTGPSVVEYTTVVGGSPDNVVTTVQRFSFTGGDYFIGKFLPVILAVMITIPLRIIDLNAKLYQPFFAMAQEGGALGRNSITLQFDGWKGVLAPFEILMQGHPVPFITTLILWSSAMLVPLATEAIGMKLHGACKITAIEGCGIQLGVSTVSAYALIAMIAFIIVLLLVLLYLLRNWETGLHANPWSIAGISSLSRNASIRSQITDFKASQKAMAAKNYMLGYFENAQGRDEYGIIYHDDSSQNLQAFSSGALPAEDELYGTNQHNIVQSSFKDATDSQSWGVRFFLSALGVIIVFCWESIFVSIAIISPYYHMDRQSQQPESSILLTRPTNSFYGIYAALLEGNVVLMLAAFMAILAEFLPILLSNIPYNLTQTLATHDICALTSISILALMLVTLVASLFIKWPHMPVDPRSIAGAMYYINESRMLEDFEGLSTLNSDDREKKVKELGRRYFYGAISGKDGRRMAVDSIESVEDTAYTGGHWFLPQTEVDHEERSSEHELASQDAGNETEHGQARRINHREVGLV